MARKKHKTQTQKEGYTTEIIGIFLIATALIGFFTNQSIGNVIKGFSIFLAGNAYYLLLGGLLILGLYLIIKREKPKFFSVKYIGIYLLVISLLIICHFEFVNLPDVEIFNKPLNNFKDAISLDPITDIQGGGILGAAFAYALRAAFGIIGLYIVTFSLLLIGFILAFNVSLRDVILTVMDFFKATGSTLKKAFTYETGEDEEPDKKVVTSVDELIKINDGNAPVNKPKDKIAIKNINGYVLPSIDILNETPPSNAKESSEDVKNNVAILEKVLRDFEIEGKVVEIHIGPTVTQYEMELKAGTKVNRVLSIHREMALALAAKDIRIQAPIPGKNTIGIEIPNKINTPVGLREMLESIPDSDNRKLLTVLGKNVMGRPIPAELSSMPHTLIAGATGSGKSVCINGIIVSILMRATPEEVKLVLIDPKKVELSSYEGIPHLLAPVVTNPKKASGVLQKIVSEMESRYELFNATKTKSIGTYNEYIDKKNKGKNPTEQEKKLPYIIVIIDELADLMLVAQKEVEDSIMRITQMARAAGIHLIVATQRPSTDVITGLIKANIPSRIAFAVSSSIDSRTILDSMGAEKLLGKGDMLFLPMGENAPQRIQGAFVSEDEIKRVVKFVSEQREAEYDENLNVPDDGITKSGSGSNQEGDDELYSEVVEYVVRTGKASTSLLQRKFSIGFNRAAKIIDQLEEKGIIGPQNGSKPREVLVKLDEEE